MMAVVFIAGLSALLVPLAPHRPTIRMCAAGQAPTGSEQIQVSSAAASIQKTLAEGEATCVASLGYEVVGRAGSGAYGSVLLARSAEGDDVAIKLAHHPAPHLAIEAGVLRAMSGEAGFPSLRSHSEAVGGSGLDAVVMERLGPCVHDVWQSTTSGTSFDGPTVLRLGRGILTCLRTLHEVGYVHNDVKPANCLYGLPGTPRADEVHLIDFGLTTPTPDADAPPTAAAADGSPPQPEGTPMFASTAVHAGEPPRPVHDVESLVYCLAYLAAGSLPWERKPPSRAAFMKRRMLTDGCSTLLDSCAAERLTENVHAEATVEALQAVWAEVVAAQEEGDSVDYDACLEALS